MTDALQTLASRLEEAGPLHPRLQKAAKAVRRAEAEYLAALKDVRAACKHEKVVEQKGGQYGADLGYHKARRICACCGYEETAWDWPGLVYPQGVCHTPDGQRTVLNAEFVKSLPFGTSHEFYRYRPIVSEPS